MTPTTRPPTPAYRGILLLLLAAAALLTFNVDSTWWGQDGHNGAWFSAAVRNYERYGALNVGLLILRNAELTTPENFIVYTHHPPLAVWMAASGAALFGNHEAVLRLVMVATTLISTAAFYVLVRRLIGVRGALWAAGFYVLTPMIAYFGRMPNHEAPALMFTLLFMAVYVRWLSQPTRARWLMLLAFGGLAAWTAWATLFFTGLACVVALLTSKSGAQRRDALLLGVLILVITAAVIGFYQLQRPETIDGLLDAFVRRTASTTDHLDSPTFTIDAFFFRQIGHLLLLATPGLLFLALIGALLLARGELLSSAAQPQAIAPLGKGQNAADVNAPRPPLRLTLLILLGGAALYLLVFRNAAYIHDYYKMYAMPALALLAALPFTAAYPAPVARFMRPITAGLALSVLIISAGVLVVLHNSVNRPLYDTMLSAGQAMPDAIIQTNLDTDLSFVGYYLARPIVLAVPPETALEQAQAGTAIFYIYCSRAPLPPILRDLPHTAHEPCAFFALDG